MVQAAIKGQDLAWCGVDCDLGTVFGVNDQFTAAFFRLVQVDNKGDQAVGSSLEVIAVSTVKVAGAIVGKMAFKMIDWQ